jgi:hypothetical protein
MERRLASSSEAEIQAWVSFESADSSIGMTKDEFPNDEEMTKHE